MGANNSRACNEAFSHRQEFLGIFDLIPIYEPFQDGAELLWEELWPNDVVSDKSPLPLLTEAYLEQKYGDPRP
jgi:hypothetical protein